jgi:HlyD family secretion protein
LLPLAILLLAGVAGAVWYVLDHEVEVETHLVLQGNIDVRQVNLAFKVDGRIETLAVDEGDTVKAGQVVATLDTRYFQDELGVASAMRDNLASILARLEHGSRPEEIAQARAQTTSKEAMLAEARADYARYKELDKTPGAISKQELDRYAAQLAVAEADAKAAYESQRLMEIGPRTEDIDAARALFAQQRAIIVQIERKLADCNLVAPSDGFIFTRSREKGAIVQAGETVFTLTLTSPVWVRTYVSERDLGLIGPGMPVQVTTDTAPGRPYAAHIGFISPTAEFTPKTVETREIRTSLVYRLRVVVDNPDGGLRQGMPVTVRLPLPEPRKRTLWQRLRAGGHDAGHPPGIGQSSVVRCPLFVVRFACVISRRSLEGIENNGRRTTKCWNERPGGGVAIPFVTTDHGQQGRDAGQWTNKAAAAF